MAYKDKYDSYYFGNRLLEATTELTHHIWTGSKESRIAAIGTWLDEASSIVGIERPEYRYADDTLAYQMTGGGQYWSRSNTIMQYHKLSLVTLLHEFAHAIQHYTHNETDEEFARGWSVSLYFLVAPEKYAAAVQKGTLRFE